MAAKEAGIAIVTRNKLLRGESVTVAISETYSSVDNPKPSPQDARVWPQVLGVFAARYSRPLEDYTFRPDTDESYYGETLTQNGLMRLYGQLTYHLTDAIGDHKLDSLANFTGKGDVLFLATKKADAHFPHTPPDESIDNKVQLMNVTLTRRGIGELVTTGIPAAIYLTEQLAADDRLDMSPQQIRDIITEEGHNVLKPIMHSPENFDDLDLVLRKEDAMRSRGLLYELSLEKITYDVQDGQVSKVRLQDSSLDKSGSFGCPFLHAKTKPLQPAWKIVVDTMWDKHLLPRVMNPVGSTNPNRS